jgi:glutathione S-transferase
VGDRASRQQDPVYMARHPMGRVPVLEDDQGGFVFESAAICLHVADSNPDAALIAPVGTLERGLVYQWSFFAMTELQASAMRVRLLREPDPQAAETAKRGLLEALAAVEQALDGHEYLVGDRFTVADLLISAALNVVRRFDAAELPPRLISYVDAKDARPAKQRAEARNP